MAVRYAIMRVSSRPRTGEAARTNEQHGQDDDEADRGLVGRGHEERPRFLHDSHDQGSGERAGRGTDAAENRRGEDRDDEAAAHQGVDAGVQAEKDTGTTRQSAAAERGDGDHTIGGYSLDG